MYNERDTCTKRLFPNLFSICNLDLITNLNNKKTELDTTKSELATVNEKVEKLSDVKVEGDTLVLPDDLIDTVEES